MKPSSSPHHNQGYGQSMSRPPAYDQGQSRPSLSSGVPELKYEVVYEPGPNGQNGHLKFTVAECRVGQTLNLFFPFFLSFPQNLKGADMRGGKPDTYVQVYLLPGKHKELKTKTIQNNSNPVFMETMNFQVISSFKSLEYSKMLNDVFRCLMSKFKRELLFFM